MIGATALARKARIRRKPDQAMQAPYASPSALGSLTQPIMPGQGQSALQQLLDQEPPKAGFMDKLGVLGGMMLDMDGTAGTGHANAARTRMDGKVAQMAADLQRRQQQARVMNLIQQGQSPATGTPPNSPGQAAAPSVGTGQAGTGMQSLLAQYAQIDPNGAAQMFMQGQAGQANATRQQQAAAQERQRLETMADQFGLQGRERLAFLSNQEQYGDSLATNYEAFNLGAGEMRGFGDGRDAVLNPKAAAVPTSIQEYQFAQSDPGFAQYQDQRAAARRSPGVTVNTGNKGPQVGSIPKGYQLTQDETGAYSMQPIPGGPVDRADGNREVRQDRAGQTVIQDVGRALEQIEGSDWASGPIAGQARRIPGTPAFTVDKLVNSAASNIGIDQLQAMRDASPTGGALGQIPFQQQKRLEQLLGSLDVTQPDAVLVDNLKRVQNLYNDIVHGEGYGPERHRLSFDDQGRSIRNAPRGPLERMENGRNTSASNPSNLSQNPDGSYTWTPR